MNKQERRDARHFLIGYIIIVVLCLIAFGHSSPGGEWSWMGAAFGAVWALLCLPGYILLFALIAGKGRM